MATKNEGEVSRREFVSNSVKEAAALAFGAQLVARTSSAEETGMPMRPLGRTGVRAVSRRLAHRCRGRLERGRSYPHHARGHRRGLTFFDNAWDYHDGGSEIVMGKALASGAKREKVFLMTKGCDRDYQGAMRCIDESLKRLQTDYLDLWQFHEIVYDNDPDWVFEQDGIRAAVEAKEAGKIRHIGFTGHRDPRIHRMMLDKPFDWETVQLPINMMDAQFRSFGREIVPTLVERGIGVIGMKTLGGGVIPGQAGVSADTCIRYALSQPVSTIVVGMMSMDELQANVATARSFEPMPAADQEALLASVELGAGDGRYELYKTTQRMDGPYHARQHGFQMPFQR